MLGGDAQGCRQVPHSTIHPVHALNEGQLCIEPRSRCIQNRQPSGRIKVAVGAGKQVFKLTRRAHNARSVSALVGAWLHARVYHIGALPHVGCVWHSLSLDLQHAPCEQCIQHREAYALCLTGGRAWADGIAEHWLAQGRGCIWNLIGNKNAQDW